jgi:penicillin amidase
LAADPHLEVNRLPAIWYEAVLRWEDGEYVMGASLPGCPLFGVGRTRSLAWGVTYLRGDSADFFIEDCRPGGTTGWQYRRGDAWHDFRLREEVITTKGRPPQKLKIYENDQGILDGDPDVLGAGLLLSVAWCGRAPGSGQAMGAWLDVIGARDVRRGMEAVKTCWQPTLCWVFADREGHIGRQAAGRLPLRGGGHSGLTPIPAWDERNHWRGWMSPEDLPSSYDPPEGFVASANEEQNPPRTQLIVTQFAPNYRSRRICERLRELPQATLADMQKLQYDVVSLQARDLLGIFLPCLEEGDVKTRLSNWQCDYPATSYEASLFLRLYRQVLLEMFGHEQGIGWRRMMYLVTRAGYSLMIFTAVDRLLARGESYWWHGRDKAQLIRAAAARLKPKDEQPWAKVNHFQFKNRFFGGYTVGRWLGFDSPRYPMPGNHATPFQGHVLSTATRENTFAPSYHFVTDLATDEAWSNLPGGPSESRFSGWYKTDIPRWLAGEYKRLVVE